MSENLLKVFPKGGEGAAQFSVGQHYVLLSVRRVTKAEEVEKYSAAYNAGKPASKHALKALGFKIVGTDEETKIYRDPNSDIKIGSERWVISVKSAANKRTSLLAIGLQVFPVDKPSNTEFKIASKVEIAMQVYREAVHVAELALQKELVRIYRDEVASDKPQKEYPNPNSITELLKKQKEKSTEKNKPAVKSSGRTLVRFKRRG